MNWPQDVLSPSENTIKLNEKKIRPEKLIYSHLLEQYIETITFRHNSENHIQESFMMMISFYP